MSWDKQCWNPASKYGCLHRHFSKPNKNKVPQLMRRHNQENKSTSENLNSYHGCTWEWLSDNGKNFKTGHFTVNAFILHQLILSQTSLGFLPVCGTSLLKTLWEKEKLLVISNFSFYHSVFYPFGELSTIFIKFGIVACKVFQSESV